jgi:SAM-dependent methyltransferase
MLSFPQRESCFLSTSHGSFKPIEIGTPMRQQILSPRFARDNAATIQSGLTGLQRTMVAAFQRRVETSEYCLVAAGCPCDAGDDTLVAEIDRYGIPMTTVVCTNCGSLRMNPYLDDSSLDHFYRSTYQTMYARASRVDRYFANQLTYGARTLALYEPELPSPSNVLEIGCGAGGGLAAFNKRGHRVAGCDLSRDLVEFGVKQGLDRLWHGTIDDMPTPLRSQRWDLIFLHHVFEHVQYPSRTLEALSRWLAPTGRVLVIVPDILRVDQFPNPAGDILAFLHVAHKFNYTIPGLEMIARQVGLAAAPRIPPSGIKTAWSKMPELWMEFRRPVAALGGPGPVESHGQRVLDYLLETERRFLAGDFSRPGAAGGPPASDQFPPRRPLKSAVRKHLMWLPNWLRRRGSNRAAAVSKSRLPAWLAGCALG